MEQDEMIVDFKKYCKICKHEHAKETEDPCNECLENPTNLYSQKPVKWEAKE